MQAPNPIAEFGAEFVKPFLMADGSPRYLFEGPEDAVKYMTPLSETKKDGRLLYLLVFDFEEWMEYINAQRK